MGAECGRTNGQTDGIQTFGRHNESNSRFSQFCKNTKKHYFSAFCNYLKNSIKLRLQ
jgi:hypothetical protein